MKKLYIIKILVLLCQPFLALSECSRLPNTPYNSSISNDYLNQGRIILVDDDGDGDYERIQNAINNASSGDSIDVYSGTYYESNITISKPDITLRGIAYELENGTGIGQPFIDGRGVGTAVWINADRIVFSGFHIENWHPDYVALALGLDGNHCVVANNTIQHAYLGLISCGSCSNCSIINNTLSSTNYVAAISTYFLCSYLTIIGNTITDAPTGIQLWDSPHNFISRNIISSCWKGITILSDYNTIYLNTVEKNTFGLDVSGYYNVIKHNNFINNTHYAARFIIPADEWHGPGYVKWVGNYWNHPRIFPFLIFGFCNALPWFNVDWWPVLKPYDISFNNKIQSR